MMLRFIYPATFGSIASLTILSACGGSPYVRYQTQLERQFATKFSETTLPSESRVESSPYKRTYMETDFDHVWTAALIVMMQGGVIARSSQERRMILCLNDQYTASGPRDSTTALSLQPDALYPTVIEVPMVVLVEPQVDGSTVAYAAWLDEMYERSDRKGEAAVVLSADARTLLAERFFDRLAVQLFSDQRWNALLPS